MKPLRPYQVRSVDCVFREWETVASTLLVLPTGTGKTRVAAEIIKRVLPKRSIFVAHRKELIWQARDYIDEIIDESFCEIEMAELWARHHWKASGTVVAMVQSLVSSNGTGRRMDRFNPEDFGLLVIDEFHHAVAETYRSVINFFRRNPKLRVLGLTATPDRLDEEALGQVCESVAFDYEILDAVQEGWLVPIDQAMVPIKGLDFSHVKTTAGDLNQSDLAAIMESESIIQGVVQPTLEFMFKTGEHALDDVPVEHWGAFLQKFGTKPRRALVFTVSVEQAETLSQVFNRVIQGLSEWVCGKTNIDRRRELVQMFSDGLIPIMVNCNCLSEGFDSPGVEIVVQARPTKSRALYAQQVGRATRPLPGTVDNIHEADDRRKAIFASAKPSCLVIDFVGNSGKHKLVNAVDILGGNVSEDAVERARHFLEKLGTASDVATALEQAVQEIKDEKRRAEERKQAEEIRQAEAAKKAKVVARVSYNIRFVNPFDVLDIMPVRARGWDSGKMISEKQRNLLLRQGINPDTLSYPEARQVICELFSRWDKKLCSIKQAQILKRFNLPTDVTRERASEWIGIISKNGWRRPASLTYEKAKTPLS